MTLPPILFGLMYAAVNSFIRAEHRRAFNAVMVAGAGAAYLSAGFGRWELCFTAVMTYVAFRGLRSWRWIGVGWLLHTAWDILHYINGKQILPFVHNSSLGCAICDPVIALWCFADGPSAPDLLRQGLRRNSAARAALQGCRRLRAQRVVLQVTQPAAFSRSSASGCAPAPVDVDRSTARR
jgi:Family of unknown function (DUF6010)